MRKRRPSQRVWLTFVRLNVVALALAALILVADWTQSRALAVAIICALVILWLAYEWLRWTRPWSR